MFPDTRAATAVSGILDPRRHFLISDTPSVEHFQGHLNSTKLKRLIDIFARCVQERTDALWISLRNA